MGFLQVVNGNEMNAEKLARLWGNTAPSKIENGGRVIVRRNEILIQLGENGIADIITEAGGYIYHSEIEKNPDKEAYAEVFAEFAESHGGFFGNRELAVLSAPRGITSPEQLNRLLLELAGENVRSEETSPSAEPLKDGKWICKCGTENDYNFCRSCGSPRLSDSEVYIEPKPPYIPASEPKTAPPVMPLNSEEMWICGECGTKNKFSYCKNCGASRKFDSEIYTAPKTYIPLSEPKTVEPPPIIPSRSGEIWICGECGTKNKFSYCKNCGASRRTDSEIYTDNKSTYASVRQMEQNVWICRCGTKNEFSFCKNCSSSRQM